MSHFSAIKLQIKNQESLVKALDALGLPAKVHSRPVLLTAYEYLDSYKRSAHVVVRHEDLLTKADLGFLFENENNEYTMIADIWELDRWTRKKEIGEHFIGAFAEEYAVAEVERLGEFEVASRKVVDGKRIIELVEKPKPQKMQLGVGIKL